MTRKLHALSLRGRLLKQKDFLQKLCVTDNNQRRKLLKNAKKNQLSTLRLLISAFVRGDIDISKKIYNKIRQTKAYQVLVKNFEKVRPVFEVLQHLLKVSSILPMLLQCVLKKTPALE